MHTLPFIKLLIQFPRQAYLSCGCYHQAAQKQPFNSFLFCKGVQPWCGAHDHYERLRQGTDERSQYHIPGFKVTPLLVARAPCNLDAFHTEEFPEVWDCICEWVKTLDQSKFDSIWEWLQTDPSVPWSLSDYLKINWMTIVPLWSGTMRKERMIFQEGDTNMLIEA